MLQLDKVDKIDNDTLSGILNQFLRSAEYRKYIENWKYYIANNPAILDRPVPDDSGPDNRIPVAYGRRIVNLVAGYMYKPGSITYASKTDDEIKQNEPFQEALGETFEINNEQIITEEVGKQAGIQGVGYEYHYVDTLVDNEANNRAVPRFCKVPATQIIPIYDWDIDPRLWAFVHFAEREGSYHIKVFYKDRWDEYSSKKIAANTQSWQLLKSEPHLYQEIPLVIYRNNEEGLSDIDPAQGLIDAYDTLISDSMNEFDRFAWAYLILKGMSLSAEDAENIKRKRIFEGLDNEDAVNFLTKDINTDYIKLMLETIRQEIHRQSGIPNIEDYTFGSGASGTSMDKFIYLMDLYVDPKEARFREGLKRRINLIAEILNYRDKIRGSADDIEIAMTRNMPDMSLQLAKLSQLYSPDVSRRTRLIHFADFVDDPDKEIEQLKAEQDEYRVDVDDIDEEDEDAASKVTRS